MTHGVLPGRSSEVSLVSCDPRGYGACFRLDGNPILRAHSSHLPGLPVLLASLCCILSSDPIRAAERAEEELMKRFPGPVRLTQRGLDIHRRSLVVDGHNDLPDRLRDL